ncbi:MAG: homocysteine S-methyltransferase family protein [Chloroflexi bacterium]|nr:homocysteine S-methyltransferase family protein [Chloroflexota bacterium]
MSESFREALVRGEILVADGATGTNYQTRGLERGLAPEQWLYQEPDQVVQLHRDFLQAGSNIILTNTFGGTALRLAHAGLENDAAQVNQRAVQLARRARSSATGNGRVWIAGSIGPSGQLLEPFGTLTRDDAVAQFGAQARALADGGVDLLVIETQFDLGEATAAFEGARAVTDLPIVVSFSFDMGTNTMMGLKAAQVAQEVTALGADMVGVNCGRSLEENLINLQEMRAATHLPLWMKPNAGLPRMTDDDIAIYDVTPEQMGAAAARWLEAGAQIVGGCCGTSPQHLQAIAQAVARARVKA